MITISKGPRAGDIEIVGQKQVKEAAQAARQTEQDIADMNAYKLHNDGSELLEYIQQEIDENSEAQTSMKDAFQKAISSQKEV